MWALTAVASVGLTLGCDANAVAGDYSADPADPGAWTIGPVIRGRNYSEGAPLHPRAGPGRGWHIDFPQRPSGIHYVTFRHGSLTGKRRMVMTYRVEAAPGVRIVPATAPDLPSIITLYFQRRGDNWSGKGRFEAYRRYATFASQSPIVPGDHVIIAPLSGKWTAVQRSSSASNQAAFREAVSDADQVGFVLGGGDGYGHGAYATGRARIIVKSFRIE